MRKPIAHIAVVLFALWFFQSGTRPPKEAATDLQLDAFARLPVKFEGRKKPVDTLARNLLTVISGRQSVRAEGRRIPAVEWLADSVSGRPEAMDYRIFRIENPDVLSSLGLKERKGFRYAYRELLPVLGKLDAAARSAFAKDDRERDLYDRQAMKAANEIYLYRNVLASFQNAGATFSSSVPLVPPPAGDTRWRPAATSRDWNTLLAAYRDGDAQRFNATLGSYRQKLRASQPAVLDKLGFELFYNRLGAFMKSAELYLLVFVLSLFGWLFRKDGLLGAARTLMACAFIPHTFAIVARVFLSGYPPVTNLYSSAIFIGWGAVLAGLVMESAFRRRAAGMGNLVGGIAGFATLLIAHFLAGDGDTLEQMRAVLDTRFWLTTHVITISLGYMATFVAGTVGVFYIFSGLLTRRLDAGTEEGLYRMMYSTTCFALLFSFVGTVLGGLWADDSWGRFWGWDPKENGALLIVLWTAIMLHARYGRMVQHRGFAVMAVGGNIVTAWSWFGVNQLGVGLHSYGFTQSATFWLVVFVLVQAAVLLLGLVPSSHWKSNRERS